MSDKLYLGEKVLIVAAHPDDEVLGVGGTIPILKAQGVEVDVVIVTDGSTAQYMDNEDKLHKKHIETQESNRYLGVDEIMIWDFPDMKLDTVAHVELNGALEELIQSKKYDCVFSQNPTDANMDHRKIYDSVSIATRPFPGQCVKRFLTYYVNSSSEWGGIGNQVQYWNFFVDIEETLHMKLEAMKFYETELRDYPHPRSIEGLEVSAKYFGSMCGYKAAEPFHVVLFR